MKILHWKYSFNNVGISQTDWATELNWTETSVTQENVTELKITTKLEKRLLHIPTFF